MKVIICNNENPIQGPIGESDVNVPVLMISQDDCNLLKANVDDGVNVTLVPNTQAIVDDFEDDEVVWGANGEGSFDNGLGDWTTVGVSDDSHLWGWSEDGSGAGFLFSGPVQSTTQCNGTAIFDFDFIHTGGLEENLPSSPIPILEGQICLPFC